MLIEMTDTASVSVFINPAYVVLVEPSTEKANRTTVYLENSCDVVVIGEAREIAALISKAEYPERKEGEANGPD